MKRFTVKDITLIGCKRITVNLFKTALVFIALAGLAFPLSAQDEAYEFEKVTESDFIRPPGIDTAAEAVVIADIGSTKFDYGSKGFYLIFHRRTRILILKPTGVSYSTILIPLYKNDNDRESVRSFKGTTYNLENNVIVKTKVRNEDIFLEDQSLHWFQQKVAMPAVKKGSLIEFEYEVNSGFLFNLQPWTFQNMIPVRVSDYSVTIPEYFNYKTLSTGSAPFALSETIPTHMKFEVYVESKLGVGMRAEARTSAHTDVYEPMATTFHWLAKDLPAFKSEPYMTTPKDFLLATEFELSTLQFPGEGIENVMGNWEIITDKLLKDDKFGITSQRGSFISDQLPFILAGSTDDEGKARAIFEAVRNRTKWNGEYGIYAGNSPRKTWESRTGSVGDINLMLTAILNEAGLKADPLILSTRAHGRIIELYPILANFNYVVACVTVDTAVYLLDATSRLMPFNTLPERCLNGTGRVISKKRSGWVELLRSETKKEFLTASLNLAADGTVSGTCTVSSGGILASQKRNEAAESTEKERLRQFTEHYSSWVATALTTENLDAPDKPLNEIFTLSMPSGVQVSGNRMYFNALLDLGRTSNPFVTEKRDFPVDFSCPISERVLMTINIPDGWTVEDLPKQSVVTLPDNGGTFRFRTQQTPGTIQFSSNLSLNKKLFQPEEYGYLRELFRMVASKHLEQVVLKKSE